MRRYGLLALALAGCATPPPPASSDRSGQEAACAAAVAAHVGRPVAEVSAAWTELTAEGTAVVTVTDDARVHTCEVGDDLAVRRILHPGAE